jgi:hypothetical protein
MMRLEGVKIVISCDSNKQEDASKPGILVRQTSSAHSA